MVAHDPNDFADLDAWPDSWKCVPEDMRVGRRLVDLLFKPFLFDLAEAGISRKTFRRHVDNLWLLGGEVIRYAHLEPRYRRAPERALLEFVDRNAGPVLMNESPRTQADVDVTFRKLARFLRNTGTSPVGKPSA